MVFLWWIMLGMPFCEGTETLVLLESGQTPILQGFYLQNGRKISSFFLKKKFDFGLNFFQEKIK